MSAPVLIVEDSDDEVLLLRRALKVAGVTAPVSVVHDGHAAIEYLSGRGAFADRLQHPLPRLMLLDLKLPRLSGLDVLKWVRAQPGLRRLPVVMLTSSGESRDVMNAYDLGVNSYLVKPSEMKNLQELARRIHEYWLDVNVHPPFTSD